MKDVTTVKLGPVNVIKQQNVVIALTKIPGIGHYQAAKIALNFKIDLTKKLEELDSNTIQKLEQFLSKQNYTIGSYTHYIGKYCRYNAKQNIKAHIALHTEVGLNQQKGYRVHGQKHK